MNSTDSASMSGFARYTDEVYGWAYRLVGRHHDALDVVQDVFLKWADQCAKRIPDQPRGWLRRVTVNRGIDLIRRRRAAPESSVETIRRQTVDETSAEMIDRTALRNDIVAALDRLTDVQRGVLVAKVYDEMTFAQIAAELGSAVSTVKTHYLRAVRVVRDRLRPRWAREES